jgi:UMF1 family MFS transporter
MIITAVIYGGASLATFGLLRERAIAQPAPTYVSGISASLRRLSQTWTQARQYRDFVWLLACGFFYQAGIAVVIALAAIYAEQVLGFAQQQIMLLVFLVNIAAALGAFGFGYWQDKIGHKRALGLTLLGWVVMTVMAYSATGATQFWGAAVIAGLCMGSSQSAGRAMVGMLAPPARLAEFFGLWTFAISLASIVGPLTYGAVTWVTSGNHRLAILITGAFFVVGWLLIRPIDMARGQSAAEGAA